MKVRRPVKAIALLGMLGIFLVQHHDAPYAVAEPAGSPEFGEFVDGPPEVFIENPPTVFVSRMTSNGPDVSQILLFTEPDGSVTLAGMESVTVTDESIVVVFDRSTEPELAEVYTDLEQDTPSVIDENPTTLRPVTSITTYGTDLSMSISAESDLFYTDDDGRVTLTRIRSVTVSEDQLVLVLDRALETESTLSESGLARAPATCHMEDEVTTLPNGGLSHELFCRGTCTTGVCGKTTVAIPVDGNNPDGPQKRKHSCSCVVRF